jgi:hypothetical protein
MMDKKAQLLEAWTKFKRCFPAIPIDKLLTDPSELENDAASARQALLPEDLEKYKARLSLWQTQQIELFQSVDCRRSKMRSRVQF